MNAQGAPAREFDSPAVYRISVLGKINASWSDRLEGMAITLTKHPEGTLVTTLEGELADQAALAGVLDSLFERHRTVLSVQRVSWSGR
jgi:hypothetical protein